MMLAHQNYHLSADARDALDGLHRESEGSSRISPTRARSAMRSTALDCARRTAFFASASGPLSATELSEISAEDILASHMCSTSSQQTP